MRTEVLGWYDFAYRINGRADYNGAVLDVYEWQVDSGEAYLAGPIAEKFDLTIGRKVVNWGRSDTFRVVDVVNPLDNIKALTFDLFGSVLDLGGSLTPFIADFLQVKGSDVSPADLWQQWRYRQRIDDAKALVAAGQAPVAKDLPARSTASSGMPLATSLSG